MGEDLFLKESSKQKYEGLADRDIYHKPGHNFCILACKSVVLR